MENSALMGADFKKLLYLQKLLESKQTEPAEKFLKDMIRDRTNNALMEIASASNSIGSDIAESLESAMKIAQAGL